MKPSLPPGIVSVVQTAFTASDALDHDSIARLVEDAIGAGVDGFLVPAVASEVEFLSPEERTELVCTVMEVNVGRVPVILGASAETAAECLARVEESGRAGFAAALVAVPQAYYGRERDAIGFFESVHRGLRMPLVVQDLQFDGPGLTVECLLDLRRRLPGLAGVKIETVPAGPKYTAVRAACGDDFWIAGGWAVSQMIEALDRGVDAMVPESSMIRIYKSVESSHRRGDRSAAVELFRKLLPVLAFTNQEISVSVAFFKRLLMRKGIFASTRQRMPAAGWDEASERTAAELIECFLELESGLISGRAD